MRYDQLAPGIPYVSQIGLGTWQLGDAEDWTAIDDRNAIQLVHHALELGVNFFDTAPNYGLGTSELRLGKAIADYDRSKIVINSKFGHQVDGQLDFSPEKLQSSIEGSLTRLKTDYLDSVLLHNPPLAILDGRSCPHYELLDRLKASGKIKAYGASVDTYEEMMLFMDTSEGALLEVFFNILHQDTARAFNHALKKNVGIIAKIPLDSGWLTGKYDAKSSFNDIRKRWSKMDIQQRARLIENVQQILRYPESLSQQAISFCCHYKAVATVIPGAYDISQLTQNVESSRVNLSSETIASLEAFYFNEVKPLNIPW